MVFSMLVVITLGLRVLIESKLVSLVPFDSKLVGLVFINETSISS